MDTVVVHTLRRVNSKPVNDCTELRKDKLLKLWSSTNTGSSFYTGSSFHKTTIFFADPNDHAV